MKNTIDKGFEVYSSYKSKCTNCQYFDVTIFICNAFPNGIPSRFLSGTDIHNKIVNSQKGEEIFNPIS